MYKNIYKTYKNNYIFGGVKRSHDGSAVDVFNKNMNYFYIFKPIIYSKKIEDPINNQCIQITYNPNKNQIQLKDYFYKAESDCNKLYETKKLKNIIFYDEIEEYITKSTYVQKIKEYILSIINKEDFFEELFKVTEFIKKTQYTNFSKVLDEKVINNKIEEIKKKKTHS